MCYLVANKALAGHAVSVWGGGRASNASSCPLKMGEKQRKRTTQTDFLKLNIHIYLHFMHIHVQSHDPLIQVSDDGQYNDAQKQQIKYSDDIKQAANLWSWWTLKWNFWVKHVAKRLVFRFMVVLINFIDNCVFIGYTPLTICWANWRKHGALFSCLVSFITALKCLKIP